MAFGATSKIFAHTMLLLGENTIKLSADAFKFALFGNTVIPSNTVTTTAKSEYAGTTSTWSTAHEASGTGYTAGGKAVTSPTWTQTAANLKFTSATNPSWSAASFTAYGGLVYDTTHANKGLCYLSFGGAQTVTAGTFTVTWSATGILKLAC